MSTRIIIRALEAERDRQSGLCDEAVRRVGQLREERNPDKRFLIDQARRILDKAASEYDAVSEELNTARADFNSARNAVAGAPTGDKT